MKTVLIQLAVLLGAGVAGISLVMNLTARMDLLTAAFRSVLVFFGTVIVLFWFLQFFSSVLIRFVTEKVLKQRAEEEKEASAQSSGDTSGGFKPIG